jgi:heme-degrading monooxygenase HmoA
MPREASAGRGEVVVVALAEVEPAARLWGYGRFLAGRLALPRIPGMRFSRMLGSGHQGGFGLRPSFTRQGVLCLFEDDAAADAFIDASSFIDGYRRRSREFLVAKARPCASRGTWRGEAIPARTAPPRTGPIAALTRASIRWTRAAAFWRHALPAEQSLERAPGCLLAAGLGEAPLVRQATFSVWESAVAMERYAWSGAHREAIRAAYDRGYFAEWMFVRFVPERLEGVWKGRRYDERAWG